MAFSHIAVFIFVWLGFQNCLQLSLAALPEDGDFITSNNGESEIQVNLTCPDLPPRTCKDVQTKESRAVVTLSDGYEVLCDTQTDGGGWVVIQRRLNQDVDFYRNWTDYKYGFGNISGNFWFGNEKIHRLTFLRRYQLRVDFTINGTAYYATYSHFRLFGESENYQLDVNGYSGNAGDSMEYHNGMAFSTPDRDNDKDAGSCATMSHGGNWYRSCHDSNLNGQWGSNDYGKGVTWYTATDSYDSASFTEMKIRPLD